MSEMDLFSMMEKVEDRICDLMDKFESEFGDRCFYECDMPDDIRFDIKGKIAGTSYFDYENGSGYLNFNPILMKENWKDFDQTVVHEVAHYCVSLLRGFIFKGSKIIMHGLDWKVMMMFFGARVERCHSYCIDNVAGRTQRKWEYKCDCDTHMISTTLHNKMQRGQQNRICKDCRTRIYYVG